MAEAVEDHKMSLIEHLTELRQRLMYAVAAFLVAFGVCWYFASDIYAFLAAPLMDVLQERGQDTGMVYTALWEAFFTEIKVAFFAGICLSFPFIATQIWLFVAPGLYSKEKRAFLPFLIATPVLFVMGAAFVYYFIFPLAWDFFVSFQSDGTDGSVRQDLLPKINEYLSIVMKLIFAFGLSFELPVLLTLMARVGLVSAEGLGKKRKYAIVIIVAVAALITPPDVISQVGLAIPILILYEISIVLARAVEKKRKAAEEAFYADIRGETAASASADGTADADAPPAYDDRDTIGLDATDFSYAKRS